MRKGEEEEEDDWEGGSTRELESADPSACKPAALQPQRNGGCRRDWLVRPGGLCFVPVEGEIASSPLLDHCVTIQVPAGDVIITRDATGPEERCCHCLQIMAFSFPYLFFLVQLQSLPARPQAGAACPPLPLCAAPSVLALPAHAASGHPCEVKPLALGSWRRGPGDSQPYPHLA